LDKPGLSGCFPIICSFSDRLLDFLFCTVKKQGFSRAFH